MLQIEGYTDTSLILVPKKELAEQEKTQLRMKDSAGRKLDINLLICNETAGFKVTFYNANCLINNTG